MASIDTVFNCVIPYIQNGDDRNRVSLVCRTWNEIDGFTRKHVTVHVHYAPSPSRLFERFPFLECLTLKGIENSNTSIDLTQWIREIAIKFTCLKSLHIRHLVIRDSDLELLAENRGKDLLTLKICDSDGFSENGLMGVAKHCSNLRELCLDWIDLVACDEEVEEHGKWLRVLALRKTGIEKFSHRYDGATTLFDDEDLLFLVERCRETLVSLRVDTCFPDPKKRVDTCSATSKAVNLQELFGVAFLEDGQNVEQYVSFKLPSSIHSLGLCNMPRGSNQFVDHLLNQLRELELRWIDVPQACQCLFLQSCPNLEVLQTEDDCGDTGLGIISQLCKKLRKLTAYSGTHVGLMAVALGCPNLEYLHVELTDIANEALKCIGSNLKNLRVFYIRLQEENDEEYNTILPLDNGIRAMLIGCTKLESIGGSDEGLMELSKGCQKLRKLKLEYCPFSDQAVKDIWLNIKSLRYIHIKSGDDTGLALTRPDFDIAQGLGIKDQLRKVAGVQFQGKITLFGDDEGEESEAEDCCHSSAKRKFDDNHNRSLKSCAKSFFLRYLEKSLKLKHLRDLVNEQHSSIFSDFSSKKDALAFLKKKVPAQLRSYVEVTDKLNRLAKQLVTGGSGLKSVKVTYVSTKEPDHLDTQLLRSMVAKCIHTSEEHVILDGPITASHEIIQVKIANVQSRFMSAISESGELKVEGTLKNGSPYLTKVGAFEVDVSLEGNIILCSQFDQPGIIGRVGTILSEEKVNVTFISVGKTIKTEAVMAIVVDKKPTLKTLEKIGRSWGVTQVVFIAL